MPRNKTEGPWRTNALILKQNNPGWTPAQVLIRLRAQSRPDWGEPPVVRTIARWLKDLPDMTEEQRRAYTFFSWPGSMTAGALPWEASAAALELLRERTDERMELPTIPLAYWYWRVSQVAPEIPIHSRHRMAISIAMGELAEPPNYNIPLHWGLAYRGVYDADIEVRRAEIKAIAAANDCGLYPTTETGGPSQHRLEDALYMTAQRPKPAEPKGKREPKPKSRKGRK